MHKNTIIAKNAKRIRKFPIEQKMQRMQRLQ